MFIHFPGVDSDDDERVKLVVFENFTDTDAADELKAWSVSKGTVKTPYKRKIGRALFFSYREFSLTWSFSKV